MKIELIDVRGFIPAIRGMRKSMQSEGDSCYLSIEEMEERLIFYPSENEYVGDKDKALMLKLVKQGDSHGAFARMIQVWVDIKASRMWWHQWDKYKFQNNLYQVEERSTSTMHTIANDLLEFTDHTTFAAINEAMDWQREYRKNPTEENFLVLKYSLPEGLLQSRTVNLNYTTLRKIYQDRQNHRLPEWKELCEWIETLPHSDLITETGKKVGNKT